AAQRVVANRDLRAPNLIDDRVEAKAAWIARAPRTGGRSQRLTVEDHGRVVHIDRSVDSRGRRGNLDDALAERGARHAGAVSGGVGPAQAFIGGKEEPLAAEDRLRQQ